MNENQLTKKELTEQIDALIVSCAIGMGCDEDELKRLAIKYATHFTGPYKLSPMHFRALDENLDTGIQLTKRVNALMDAARSRLKTKSMGSFVAKKMVLPQTCKCTPTMKYPFCKMPLHLCKYTNHTLATMTARKSPNASPKASPKASPTKCRKPGCSMMGGKRTKRRRN